MKRIVLVVLSANFLLTPGCDKSSGNRSSSSALYVVEEGFADANGILINAFVRTK